MWNVQILIGDEPKEGLENLMEVEIPDDVAQKLKDMDAKEQEQLEKAKWAAYNEQHSAER